MTLHTSPYALVGSKLVEKGFSAIPLIPAEKCPGRFIDDAWRPMFDWNRYCGRLPTTEYETPFWDEWPDAGVGLALGFNNIIAVDIDTDDKAIIAAIMGVIGDSPCAKRGAKGKTLFFRGKAESRSYNVNGLRVCDLLGYGRQTVLPPSLHKNTGQAYIWIGYKALSDISPEDLPELSDNAAELIADALRPFGYRPEDCPGAGTVHDHHGDTDLPFRDLNDAALANLSLWVPRLGLARCKRVGGKYVAVADWRPSNTGRGLEHRKLNLSISPKGISDFGDGPKGYTPLNLVMAALACDRETAFMRLSEWLGRVHDPIVLNERISTVLDFQTDEGLGEKVDGAKDDAGNDYASIGLRSAAQFIDEYVPITYSVGGVLAEMALYFLTGRSGCGKTTIASVIALAVATGDASILGVPVERGRVAFIAFENPDNFRQQLAVAVAAHCPFGIPDNFTVIDNAKPLEVILKALAAEARLNGDYRLIIIDSFQASFPGDDFNNPAQTLKHTRKLRRFTVEIPGCPTVLVLAHPVKNAGEDNLIPYGGGSTLNEMDGNLTAWQMDSGVRVHWQGKFRGHFEPMTFQLRRETCAKIHDKDGELLPRPVAYRVLPDLAEAQEGAGEDFAIRLLRVIATNPGGTQRTRAEALGVGQATVNRALKKLEAEKLVTQTLKKWRLTPKGEQFLADPIMTTLNDE